MNQPLQYKKLARLNTEIDLLKEDLSRVRNDSIKRQISNIIRLKEMARDQKLWENAHPYSVETFQPSEPPAPPLRKTNRQPKKVKEVKTSRRRSPNATRTHS